MSTRQPGDSAPVAPQTSALSAARRALAEPDSLRRWVASAVQHRVLGPLQAHRRPGGVAIFHVGRCGSTVLSEMVAQHPRLYWDGETYVRVIHELKRQGVQRPDSGFDPVEYVARRLSRSGSRHFGFDLKFSHVLDFGLSLEDYITRLDALGIDKIISLKRENYLLKTVSTINGARRSRHYHLRGGQRDALPPLVLDPTAVAVDGFRGSLNELFDRIELMYAELERVVPPSSRLDLTYESDVEHDPSVGARRILDFIGLDPAPMDVTLSRMNPEPLGELVGNLPQIREYLHGTRYAWMVDQNT